MKFPLITLDLVRGDSLLKDFILKDGNGNPIDLTGCSITLQIRRSYNGARALVTASTSTGEIATPSGDGKIDLALSPSVTSAIPDGAVYDVQIVYVDGTIRTEFGGSINVLRDVVS